MSYLGDSFDPNSPTVEAADKACAEYMVAEPVSPAVSAQVLREQLEYAQCMQTHGEPGFPDPSSSGGFTIPRSVDQNSGSYRSAEEACQSSLPGPPVPSGS